jgi:hypothetical protein
MAVCWSCTQNSGTEKHQGKRDNVVNVRDKVKEIVIPEEDVMIGSVARLYMIDDYLIIKDYHSYNELIHIFDKNNFNHLISAIPKGEGPGEIVNMGDIAVDETNRRFFVSDHGKQRIFDYALDSLLADPSYMPEVKMEMIREQFPGSYHYINDTLCIGLIIEPVGVGDFRQSVAKWNMNTGEIKPMPYEHPDIKKKRITFAASMEHGIYVECYHYHDLMTICSLDGELKYNIYGRHWSSERTKISYSEKVVFCGDRIVVSYSGENTFSNNEKSGVEVNFPTKFHVFDLTGNYLQTLETEYRMQDFCYDKENNRIIMAANDDIQFACLELDGLIK